MIGNEVDIAFRKIWSECMPGQPFSDEVTLLEAGVSSLKAMEIFFKVEMALNISVSLSKIGASNKISEIIQGLSRDAGKSVSGATGGDTRIILSGLFGEELHFLSFLDAIADTEPFHSEPLPGIEAPCELQTEIGAVAKHLAQRILESGIRGNLVLAGVSYGAVVAHEIARHLVEQGHEVQSLVLIDPLLSPSKLALFKRTVRRALHAVGRRGATSGGADPARATLFLERWATLWVLGLLFVGAFRTARDFIVASRVTRDPAWVVQRTREYFAVTRGRAIQCWSGGTCAVPTTIIAGTDFDSQSSLHRWRALCPDLTVERIEADHFTIFAPEHSAALRSLFLKAARHRDRVGEA